MNTTLGELMTQTGVRFGTSGVRGLVTALTDFVAYAYTRGFLQYLTTAGDLPARGGRVALAGDLRSSTDRILGAVGRAVQDLGHTPVNAGKIPSSALALYGLSERCPAIMVTGSHIPDDRNGIKFNKTIGEILKEDERAIAAQVVTIDEQLFDSTGAFVRGGTSLPAADPAPRAAYLARYVNAFAPDTLQGLRLGVYEHSAVGRELIAEALERLGASVTPLGRTKRFVPVDTEAIRPEDVALAAKWAAEHRFDAIVSADGDSDRPLISDEEGRWLRGDVAGILCARFLGADSVSTPVSCNTAVEKCGWFPEVRRTRIGSPYVVASMMQASAWGAQRVVGYEANGGFLINSDLDLGGRVLRALPTRDALIVILSLLQSVRQEGKRISQLVSALPPRFTASDRLADFPTARGHGVLNLFTTGNTARDREAIEGIFGAELGRVTMLDRTDGLRITFANGEIVHLRPSGNAPEFRCYTEAASEARARELNARCLEIVRGLGSHARG
jgi:phosphomannomutase